METTAIVMATTLAALFLVLGSVKVLRQPGMVERMAKLGYSASATQGIGALEIAGAVGLVVGSLLWPTLAVAAAIGLVLLLVGAAVSHVRAGDAVHAGGPVWIGLVTAATAVLTIVAM